MSQRTPEPHGSFAAWLDAQQVPAPRSPEEAELHRTFVIGLSIAWQAGFQAGVMAKERSDGSPLPHTPKENDDA
jgi:hypothetical protein